MKKSGLFVSGILFSLLAATIAFADNKPMVTISNGKIEGISKDGVNRYLGIPFAKPPIGELRWRAPQDNPPWQGKLEAHTYGPDCMQMDMDYVPGPGYVNPESEDCLYLNVWTPKDAQSKKLPVMVWIYGGAFIMGSSSYPAYDGTTFAKDGVIMVSFNYRLGKFGFFAHPALKASGNEVGNYGFMDQIKALEWVHNNIAAFGGDPSNVTIFGESAGASSVNFLMASPTAKKLFQKAISESGGSNATIKPLSDALKDGEKWGKKFNATTAADLRALPAASVLDLPNYSIEDIIADNITVKTSTPDAYKNGEIADIPYIVGANNYEESLIRWLPGSETELIKSLGKYGEKALQYYTQDGANIETAQKRLWGEYAMTLPARQRAEAHAKISPSTWLYRFGYVPETLRETMPGAGHENEIEFVFDNREGRTTRHEWTASDINIAKTMHAYWVNFAKSGNPNGAGLLEWKSYNQEGKPLIHFTNQGIKTENDFAKKRLDALEKAVNATDSNR